MKNNNPSSDKFKSLPDECKVSENGALYFAYGSNLNLQQMKVRCPNARPLKIATLKDFQLKFCGANRCGVATVDPCPGTDVVGGLWLITPQCIEALDAYEGYPRLYDREVVTVVDEHGIQHNALTYYMLNYPPLSLPSKYYFNTIVEGYDDFGLDIDYLHVALTEPYKKNLNFG